MSRKNVELARQSFDAFNRRDFDAFVELMDPEVEASSRLVAIEGGYRGHEGIRRWWDSLFEVFPDFTIDVVEVRDLGDLTLSVLRNEAHGAGSDVPIEEALWHIAEWREKKVVQWTSYEHEAEALEAAELSE